MFSGCAQFSQPTLSTHEMVEGEDTPAAPTAEAPTAEGGASETNGSIVAECTQSGEATVLPEDAVSPQEQAYSRAEQALLRSSNGKYIRIMLNDAAALEETKHRNEASSFKVEGDKED